MKGELRRGFVLLTLGQVLFIVCGYATHVILARRLGPAEYGTYGVVLSALSTVALVLTGGMPEAIAKFAAEKPGDAEAIFAQGMGIQFRFSILLALAYAASSPLVGLALHDPTLTPALALSALAVPPVALYSVVIGAFNGQRRFLAQALSVGGYGVSRALLVIVLAARFRIWGAVIGFILAPLLTTAFGLPSILRRPTSALLDSRALWRFARPVIGFTIALTLLMGIDLFIVKSLVSNAELVGCYVAAATIAKVPYFFFSTLGVVLLPIVSSAGADAGGHVLSAAKGAIRLIFAVALGVAAVGAPFSQAVLQLLYGERYVAAALPLALLIVAMTIFTLTFIVAYTLNGLGHPGIAMRLTALGLGLEALLAVPMTQGFGATGAAAASCVVSVAVLIALVHGSRPLLGVLITLKSLVRLSVAFLGTLAIGYALPHIRPPHLLWCAPIAAGYVVALVLMRELSWQDLSRWLRRERR